MIQKEINDFIADAPGDYTPGFGPDTSDIKSLLCFPELMFDCYEIQAYGNVPIRKYYLRQLADSFELICSEEILPLVTFGTRAHCIEIALNILEICVHDAAARNHRVHFAYCSDEIRKRSALRSSSVFGKK
jgi:hypothetical protein